MDLSRQQLSLVVILSLIILAASLYISFIDNGPAYFKRDRFRKAENVYRKIIPQGDMRDTDFLQQKYAARQHGDDRKYSGMPRKV